VESGLVFLSKIRAGKPASSVIEAGDTLIPPFHSILL
jgi:hypothetical protein